MVCLALIHWIVIYRVDGAFHPTNFEQVAEASGFLARLAFFIGKTARSMEFSKRGVNNSINSFLWLFLKTNIGLLNSRVI